MSPPQLARDVPVADALEPIDVNGFPFPGQNANGALAYGFERRSCQRFHLHEPLIGEARLDDSVAAVAVPDRVLMRFHTA